MYICFMKKYILILGLGVSLILTSCGGESTTTETSDSTSVDSVGVQVDSSSVTATDSTVAQMPQNDDSK